METSPLPNLVLGDQDYFAMPGLNVLLGQDYYPDGHQAGLVVLQHGKRVASNGDLRLETAGGQWQPVPRQLTRTVSEATQTISVTMAYPDPARNRTGFNPIEYPDLAFSYHVSVTAEGRRFRVGVDLEAPLPSPWDRKVCFCLELFPGLLFGRSFAGPQGTGTFPRQPNGPSAPDPFGDDQLRPLVAGSWLAVAPEAPDQRLRIEVVEGGELVLLDGRQRHNNGWFVVQASLTPGKAGRVLEWLVEASADPRFVAPPVVQINQVGYRCNAEKRVVVELDPSDTVVRPIRIERLQASGERSVVAEGATDWGRFLRSRYLSLDFSSVTEAGAYLATYGEVAAGPFHIGDDVYSRHVWQPTLEYFLPVQMCHMRVEDGYRVWHGACHRSDALMASPGLHHFDGYRQGPTTLCAAKGGEKLRGLNEGGWHDAGDFDLRVESQAETVHGLALAREQFGVEFDSTTVSWSEHLVVLHRPDGTPDILEQIEHGLKSLLGGWKALGRPYRGIIEATLKDYVLLGDPVNHGQPRLVFTEEQPAREALVGAALAAASRILNHKPALAKECLEVALRLWDRLVDTEPQGRLILAVELLLCGAKSTGENAFARFLHDQQALVSASFDQFGWLAVRVLDRMDASGYRSFRTLLTEAGKRYRATLEETVTSTPYGLPYRPNIWGAGWQIQNFGMRQVFLHLGLPGVFDTTQLYRAFDFLLGCHPGANNASFVTGVGSRSVTTAYGLNRADGGSIPGGAVSGTALIRPDFPELLEWPYLWQQTEYVLGGGTTDWLLLALAADKLNRT